MNHALRISVVAAFATALAACGGGAKLAPGKQNAASAAYMASQGSSGANGGIFALARQNASFGVDFTRNCTKAGKATVHYVIDTTDTTGAITFDLTYSGCSFNGKTDLNGTMHVKMNINVTSTSADVVLSMNGRVDFSGDISDFVNVTNFTETLDLSKLSTDQGISLSLALNGTIQTSTDTYTYSNETYAITTGDLQAAASK